MTRRLFSVEPFRLRSENPFSICPITCREVCHSVTMYQAGLLRYTGMERTGRSEVKTVLTQDHFYSTFISTWFSNVDILNTPDDRIRFLSSTRDVGLVLPRPLLVVVPGH
jgi:hypothetical protein